jgi:hypothetical protein
MDLIIYGLPHNSYSHCCRTIQSREYVSYLLNNAHHTIQRVAESGILYDINGYVIIRQGFTEVLWTGGVSMSKCVSNLRRNTDSM